VGGGAVYFGTRDGELFAVDAATGKQRWTLATGRLMAWPWGHESGDVYTSSPAFDHGMVFFGGGDGRVYAVNAATGKEKWHAQTEGRVRASPAVDASRVYVGSADGLLELSASGTPAAVREPESLRDEGVSAGQPREGAFRPMTSRAEPGLRSPVCVQTAP